MPQAVKTIFSALTFPPHPGTYQGRE